MQMRTYRIAMAAACVALLGCAQPAAAQSAQQRSNPGESFQQFRQKMLDDYQQFRGRILDHYADFLEGTWHEYESQQAERRDDTPKPKSVPSISGADAGTISDKEIPTPGKLPSRLPGGTKMPNLKTKLPHGMQAPGPGRKPQPKPTPAPAPAPKPEPTPEPAPDPTPAPAPKPEPKPTPAPAPAPTPKPEPKPAPAPTPAPAPAPAPTATGDRFKFYDMEFVVPTTSLRVADLGDAPAQIAALWRSLDSQPEAKKLVKDLSSLRSQYNLNGYLTLKAVEAYVHDRFSSLSENARMTLIFYLLNNLGYDVRLGKINSRHNALLVPYDERIYGQAFWNIGDKRYYVVAPPSVDMSDRAGILISTCDLPPLGEKGDNLSVKISDLKLPYRAEKFDKSYGSLHLTGEVNGNLREVLRHYPLMDMDAYAASVIDPSMRRNLVGQVRSQLGEKDKKDAVNALLRFTQRAFDYATDDESHGYEKPYFLEENFLYPKNDCEDRAIFYTYLLWNGLGVNCQLLRYPGHEAASVSLDSELNGCHYDYEGRKFYISDPTYVGSRTGQCMPDFETVAPIVEYYYR